MFDDLQKRLSSAFKRFRVSGVLTEANMKEGLREVRTALLEADVNFNVVQDFMARIQEQAVGAQVVKSVRPEQQLVKIVHDEMIATMGPSDPTIRFEKTGPTVIMLCGLQGSGKTTTSGKLAKLLVSQERRPMLVAADLQRPAAVEQLKVVGEQVGVPVFSQAGADPVKLCQDAVIEANRKGCDTLILDTAGRLHVDDELMAELVQIEKKVRPHQVYFVCDAMTGQDAVASAAAFNKALELDGVILTKLDGDARGGAALSVRKVTGVPVKFVGKGEKLDKLEPFDPERLVGQMLGMGDIVGLVEAAQASVDAEEARLQQEKMAKGKFDLEDFRKQIIQIKKMGSVQDVMGMFPGMGQMTENLGAIDADAEIRRIQGIIDSMTPRERSRPDLIDIGRRRRIAAGAGVEPSDVSGLVKQFDAMAAFVKQMSQMSMLDKIKAMTGLGRAAASNPTAKLFAPKVGTGKRLTPKEKEKLRKQREKEERKKRRDQRDQPGA
ncbi:signal recognition particle protein [Planctomyces sp. SH-PL62]|uniref:signal recognition particle protein n=1 Tax=Planctomyces sp. SH-PL62 TaxID=1636152 RepID=UPI00078DC2C0|nr:signal recognition particle protein [Planctomyces sp. SH-PL62]AMV37018.1 Signal recognition particle protein [Planctomyces sp. SH-PL62]